MEIRGSRFYGPLFLLLVAVAALVLCGRAATGLWSYFELDQEAHAQIERWEIERTGRDAYGLIAHYTFDYQGGKWSGSSRWSGRPFPNRLAAEAKIVRLREAPLQVYFPSGKPGLSVLHRTFPLKATVYALIGLGVALYFGILTLLIRTRKDHAPL